MRSALEMVAPFPREYPGGIDLEIPRYFHVRVESCERSGATRQHACASERFVAQGAIACSRVAARRGDDDAASGSGFEQRSEVMDIAPDRNGPRGRCDHGAMVDRIARLREQQPEVRA